MDALAFDTVPPARQLIELLKKRGWTGWTKLERVDPVRQEGAAVRRSRRWTPCGQNVRTTTLPVASGNWW